MGTRGTTEALAADEIDGPPASRRMEDHVEALFLSLRSCATHTAGPLRAVARLAEAVDAGDLSTADARAVCDQVTVRFCSMTALPRERQVMAERFLAALFT